MGGRQKKKVSMKQIAEKLGLSINAVSLALNDKNGVSEKTRGLVFHTAADMGYFSGNPVFQGGRNSRSLCMIISKPDFEDRDFYSKVILGIEGESRRSSYDLIVEILAESDGRAPSCVASRKTHGILAVGDMPDAFLRDLNAFGLPIMTVNSVSYAVETDAVLAQNAVGAFKAADYLLRMGHRAIGFAGDLAAAAGRERWHGYSSRMRQAGAHWEQLLPFTQLGPMGEYAARKEYERIAEQIAALPFRPTAWLCAADQVALALSCALRLLGDSVPDDASLIGYGDTELGRILVPHLTTVRVDKEYMGVLAVRRLIEKIENRETQTAHIRIPVSLVERETVRKLKAEKPDAASES